MTKVSIVDADAEGLAQDLNAISKRDKLDTAFAALTSPEQLFATLNTGTPDLVLIHHHWPGLTIAQLLQRLADDCKETRVIVFTGQALNSQELIECVRFGAADYWTNRGSLDLQIVFSQISHYCSSTAWTIERLRMPSGSLQKLLQSAEAGRSQIVALETSGDKLRSELERARSAERQELIRTVASITQVATYALVIPAAFVAIVRFAKAPTYVALLVMALVAAFCLFADGKLTKASLNWRKRSGSASVEASHPAPNSRNDAVRNTREGDSV